MRFASRFLPVFAVIASSVADQGDPCYPPDGSYYSFYGDYAVRCSGGIQYPKHCPDYQNDCHCTTEGNAGAKYVLDGDHTQICR
ncbi:hypothetical protein EJ03DRAFT_328197 [Teratosphaeria nubilosa]|uniref:Uncharacterized protein n=1 Tax=Teratosphaeria nubilosa TaxID=161662 RepID=A0A6G1L6N4_9PEZI|nr:hypothetical protein EJ03DRAFT_328197 [Teratosphaeria nubilosa]